MMVVAGPDVIMGAMAHVQAEHVGPGLEQGADRCIVAGSRAKGGHNLHVTKASHAFILFIANLVHQWAAGLMAELTMRGNWRFGH